jgi:hypothetical protein
MALYWFLFLVPALWAISFSRPRYTPPRSALQIVLWSITLLGLTITIGFRHEVGGDWGHYLTYLDLARSFTLNEAMRFGDPAFTLLNWVSANVGGGVYFVNVICGLLFSLGLVSFCRQLPRAWLSIAIAMPYLVLVVGMGYTRQGVALGIVMWGLTALYTGKKWRFVLAIGLAGLFHKSAVVIILIAFVMQTKNKFFTFAAIGLAGVGLYILLLADAVEALKVGYLDAEYQSAGAGVRVAMNALPGILFLWYRRRFVLTPELRKLWTYMSLASIGMVGLLFASPSSTAVDRLALYLIPLQLFFWSHLPDAIGKVGRKNLVAVLLILSFYATVLFVWLFFADHRALWIPYKFFPFELL